MPGPGRPANNPLPDWAERLLEKTMTAQAALIDLNRELETVFNARTTKNKRPRKLEVA